MDNSQQPLQSQWAKERAVEAEALVRLRPAWMTESDRAHENGQLDQKQVQFDPPWQRQPGVVLWPKGVVPDKKPHAESDVSNAMQVHPLKGDRGTGQQADHLVRMRPSEYEDHQDVGNSHN